MQTRVQNDGEYSEPFQATKGVKQICVMAQTLFRMMLFGFPIKLFNLRWLQAKLKVHTEVIDTPCYADNIAEIAKQDMDSIPTSC